MSICKVRRIDPDRITAADFRLAAPNAGPAAIFIHIGNSWVHHSGFLRLAHRVPAVIVLHDLAIQELCLEAISHRQFSRSFYIWEMTRWYGEEGYQIAMDLLAGRVRPYEIVGVAPGFELAFGRAVSVLCHTSTAFQEISKRDVCLYQLDLPFKVDDRISDARREDKPLRLVQFGYIGPNRRLEQILEALSELTESMDFRFSIFGKLWDADRIHKQIRHLGLSGRVEVRGFVQEDILDSELRRADLVFNLRHPTMGEASGSQLRIWNAGAASVVTKDGWYGSLPDDTVFSAPIDLEKDFIKDTLLRVNVDRERLRKMGRSGRQYLLDKHQPQRYVGGIMDITGRFSEDVRASFIGRALSDVLGDCSTSNSTFMLHYGLDRH